jgi:hypothetical protein
MVATNNPDSPIEDNIDLLLGIYILAKIHLMCCQIFVDNLRYVNDVSTIVAT